VKKTTRLRLVSCHCSVLIALLLGGAGPAIANPQVLTAVYGDFITPPAVIRGASSQPDSGYLIDIYRELSQQLGMQLQLKPFARADIAGALLKSEADLYCRANPAWYPQPLLRWSPPLFGYADMLLSHRAVDGLSALAQQQTVVATTRGYRYPELEPLFRAGRSQRQDHASPDEAAAAFLAGQADAVVMSEIEAHYLLPVSRLQQLQLGHYQLHCVYSPRLKPLQRQLLDNYISARASQGDFKALLQKYSWQLSVKQPAKTGL
jgi:polar amino acid transport system substrate-binding protein